MKQNSLLSQRGKTSAISNLLLSNQHALQLLEHDGVNSIEWKDNNLKAYAVVRKKRQESLKEILEVFEKLGVGILDELVE